MHRAAQLLPHHTSRLELPCLALPCGHSCRVQGGGMGIYATALTSGSGSASQVKLGGIVVLVGLAAQVGARMCGRVASASCCLVHSIWAAGASCLWAWRGR